MKPGRSTPLVGWAVLAAAIWQSADLLEAWRHSPLDRLGWLALGLWLAPVAWAWRRPAPVSEQTSLSLLGAAVAAILAGVLLELHGAAYAALALAISAIARPPRAAWLWLVLSVSWMPFLSWASRGLPLPGLIALRLALAAAAAGVAVWGISRPAKPSC